MGEVLAIGVYVVWLALSLSVLIPKVGPVIRLLDGLFLIPEWKFFAPNPARGDFHLLYRDRLADGTLTPWTEVAPGEPRRWWNIVWNPGRRGRKALFDAGVEIGQEAQLFGDGVIGSMSYLTLLCHVSTLPRLVPPDRTQFLVLYTFGDRAGAEPMFQFVSDLHSL
jgi:hypothetical protein